jgi:hypothetical protein
VRSGCVKGVDPRAERGLQRCSGSGGETASKMGYHVEALGMRSMDIDLKCTRQVEWVREGDVVSWNSRLRRNGRERNTLTESWRIKLTLFWTTACARVPPALALMDATSTKSAPSSSRVCPSTRVCVVSMAVMHFGIGIDIDIVFISKSAHLLPMHRHRVGVSARCYIPMRSHSFRRTEDGKVVWRGQSRGE